MRRGDRRTITVDRKQLDAVYLGRGRYATAYQADADKRVYLFVDEEDYSKEIIEHWVEDGLPHVPEIKRHDQDVTRGKYRNVYSMPFYPGLTAKDREAWKVYRVLKEAADRIHRTNFIAKSRSLAVEGMCFMNDVIEDTRGKVPESVSEALEALMNAASNCGSGMCCEFAPRNLGTDGEGRIVFRDILFDAEKIQREWAAKSRQRRGY